MTKEGRRPKSESPKGAVIDTRESFGDDFCLGSSKALRRSSASYMVCL